MLCRVCKWLIFSEQRLPTLKPAPSSTFTILSRSFGCAMCTQLFMLVGSVNGWCFLNRENIQLNPLPRLPLPFSAVVLVARCVRSLCCVGSVNGWCFLNTDYIHLNPLPRLTLPSSAVVLVARCVHEMSQTVVPKCFIIPPMTSHAPLHKYRVSYSLARTMPSITVMVSAWEASCKRWRMGLLTRLGGGGGINPYLRVLRLTKNSHETNALAYQKNLPLLLYVLQFRKIRHFLGLFNDAFSSAMLYRQFGRLWMVNLDVFGKNRPWPTIPEWLRKIIKTQCR
jgi:hypothetical protein